MSEFASNIDRLIGERKEAEQNKTAELTTDGEIYVRPSNLRLSAAKIFWQAFMAWLRQKGGKANLD
jgi:hypothetical protein